MSTQPGQEPDMPEAVPALEVPDAGQAVDTGAPAASGIGPELSEVERLLHEVETLNGRIAEQSDRVLRAQAELDNFRKRSAREIENAHKYALERFLQDLLPVVDSLELGLRNSAEAADQGALRQGMELTLKKLLDVLQKYGVVQVNPDGEKFNPERHQAVSVQELPGAASGDVIGVMQKGYELNGRVIRPAIVAVAK